MADKKDRKPENPPAPAKPAPASKPAGKGKKKNESEGVRLPMLLEMVFSFATFLLIAVDVVVAALSYLAGAELVEIFLRTGVATIAVGALLWVLTWQLSTGAINAAQSAMKDAENGSKKQGDSSSGHFPEA